jgi:hypothetical protein
MSLFTNSQWNHESLYKSRRDPLDTFQGVIPVVVVNQAESRGDDYRLYWAGLPCRRRQRESQERPKECIWAKERQTSTHKGDDTTLLGPLWRWTVCSSAQ